MQVICEIFIDFEDQKKVETILRSVKIDDLNFVKSKSDKKKLIAHIESKSISSIINTLDDYLACVTIASKISDKH